MQHIEKLSTFTTCPGAALTKVHNTINELCCLKMNSNMGMVKMFLNLVASHKKACICKFVSTEDQMCP